MKSPVTKGAAYVGVLVEGLRVTIFIDHARFTCDCVDERHRDRVAAEAYDALDCWPEVAKARLAQEIDELHAAAIAPNPDLGEPR